MATQTTTTTTAVYPNAFNKAPTSPGASSQVIEYTTTVTDTATLADEPSAFSAFLKTFGALAGVLFFLGGVLVVIGSGLVLGDINYLAIGILWAIGYGLWFFASVFNWIASFGFCAKGTRSSYMGMNFTATILLSIATAALTVAAAFYIANTPGLNNAGRILWVAGGALFVLSLAIRSLAVSVDGISGVKRYAPGLNRVQQEDREKRYKKYRVQYWGNVVTTMLYFAASIVFEIGAVMFLIGYRNAEPVASSLIDFGAVLWIITGALFMAGAISHCVARK
jgi:hypothetical protein